MQPQVFAFAKIDNDENESGAARHAVYNEIRAGKSRFGMWDQECSLKERYHGANAFLLRIQKGDWIVHVNSPEYGHCVAVQAVGEYQFDEGIEVSWGDGRDFNNFIPVDPASVVEFERNDPNILPSINLAPRRRAQRVLCVKDFLDSLKNVREQRFHQYDEGLKGLVHIRAKMASDVLPKITELIHQMNRSKEFEKFLHKVFGKIPNVKSVMNGFHWGSDFGADLIVDCENPLIKESYSTRLVVQAKSYENDHYDLHAVDQLKEAIAKFSADGGLLITTAKSTEELEDKVLKVSEEIGKPIDIMAGADVAKFVLKHAPHLLLDLRSEERQKGSGFRF